MANNSNRKRAYGFDNALQKLASLPILARRNPTTRDKRYPLGTPWINEVSNRVWSFTSVTSGSATWIELSSGTPLPEIETLTGDSGGAVGPDAVNNLNIVGGTGITSVGTPGTNTITLNASAGEASISRYIVDADGTADYVTIQAALTAANTAGVPASVYVRPGAYVEDLTLYDGISLLGGDVLENTLTGIHTPPASGTFTIRNFNLASATDVFNSAAAGTTELFVEQCVVNVTNGYLFNLTNWTGDLIIDDCGSIGTNDGVVSNTGGSSVKITDATVGNGSGNAMATSGATELFSSVIQCPYTAANGTTGIAEFSLFKNTVSFTGNGALSIDNSAFRTGANAAITHSSSSDISISEVMINSSAVTVITGAGAGNLNIGNVTFEDSSVIAATLTQNYFRTTNRISAYIVGPTGNFATIQAALDAANASAAPQSVYVQAGAYTENLTFYTTIDLIGSSPSETIITGTHVPPAAGRAGFYNCRFIGTSDVFNTAVGGTAELVFDNCDVRATNGYFLDLLNWTGNIKIFNLTSTGSNDGFLNNGAKATITARDSELGVGAAFNLILSGSATLKNVQIRPPMAISGTAGLFVSFDDVTFAKTLTTSNQVQTSVTNSSFETIGNTAITHNSSSPFALSESLINSSHVTAIGGTGAGNFDLGSVTFENSSGIAGALTVSRKTFETGNVKATGVTFTTGTHTLTHYAEGTWTPVLNFGGATTGITYATQIGSYTRVGRLVFFSLQISLTSKGTAVGLASITGLPINVGVNQSFICQGLVASIAHAVNYATFTSIVGPSDSTIFLYEIGNNVVDKVLDNTQFVNTSDFRMSGCYEA